MTATDQFFHKYIILDPELKQTLRCGAKGGEGGGGPQGGSRMRVLVSDALWRGSIRV